MEHRDNKVDHPEGGSKDIADAIVGCTSKCFNTLETFNPALLRVYLDTDIQEQGIFKDMFNNAQLDKIIRNIF